MKQATQPNEWLSVLETSNMTEWMIECMETSNTTEWMIECMETSNTTEWMIGCMETSKATEWLASSRDGWFGVLKKATWLNDLLKCI